MKTGNNGAGSIFGGVAKHGRRSDAAPGILASTGFARITRLLPRDPRIYQIVFLGSLLSLGVLARDFALAPEQMLLTFTAGILTQLACVRALGLKRIGVLSAMITCFGLSILVRADSLWVHPLVAGLAIASKFTLRVGDKHVYNPANLGVIVALTLLPGAWVSAGQWGTDLLLAGWFVALGGIVTSRAQRSDISVIFVSCYALMLAARVIWLEQAWSIYWHQLASGALLLFTFFMVSDPMTTPNRPAARCAYAFVVALGAFIWQYWFFKPHGLIWALFLAAPLVPVLDRILPATKFEWRGRAASPAGREA